MGLYENVKRLCDMNNKPMTRVEKELGFSRGSLGKLRQQESMGADRLRKLAEYFGVSQEYLTLGKEIDVDVITIDERTLLSTYRRLSAYHKAILETTAKALSESETSENKNEKEKNA